MNKSLIQKALNKIKELEKSKNDIKRSIKIDKHNIKMADIAIEQIISSNFTFKKDIKLKDNRGLPIYDNSGFKALKITTMNTEEEYLFFKRYDRLGCEELVLIPLLKLEDFIE